MIPSKQPLIPSAARLVLTAETGSTDAGFVLTRLLIVVLVAVVAVATVVVVVVATVVAVVATAARAAATAASRAVRIPLYRELDLS